jgi:hypothetical protein
VKAIILSFAMLFAVSCSMTPAYAGPCRHATAHHDYAANVVHANPDGRTSITLTAGTGKLDGLNAGRDSDLRTLGVALVYPASRDLSLLARYDYGKSEWNGSAIRRCDLTNWNTDVFTVGVRLYLGG